MKSSNPTYKVLYRQQNQSIKEIVYVMDQGESHKN